jgi:hypothetical protein
VGPHAAGSGTGADRATLKFQAALTAVAGKAATREPGPGEEGVPISRAQVLQKPLDPIEPRIVRQGNRIVLVGSELITQIVIPPAITGVPATVPQGGLYTMIPLNPMFCDGMRVAKMMAAFDQWALRRVVLEYIPMTNAVAAVGGITMVVSNDASDLLNVEGGFSALRDAMSRPGSATFNVYAGAAASENQPLLKWYYTARADEADFEIPGMAIFMSATDQSNATTTPVPLGLVWMHYEIELRSAENQQLAPQSYASNPLSLVFTNCASVANVAISVPAAGAGLPASHAAPDVIGWGSIVAADDTAWGSTTWRVWRTPVSGKSITINPGSVIFWRWYTNSAGVANYSFFATFKEALEWEPITVEGAFITTVNQVAGTVRGFKVAAVQGSQLPGF